MTIEDPDVLLRRLRLGREEYCQRLLTMLIIGDAYPRWNSVSQPSTNGLEFLNRLYLLSFGRPPSESLDGCSFIDEFDLPARRDEEKGGAPDYAVVTATLLWMIELKTEPASHRRGQLSTYMELAKHHHPNHLVELTYLTPPLKTEALSSESVSYGHVTWGEVMPLIGEVWAEGNEAETRCCEVLTDVLADLDTAWTVWREQRIAAPVLAEADPMAEALIAGRADGGRWSAARARPCVRQPGPAQGAEDRPSRPTRRPTAGRIVGRPSMALEQRHHRRSSPDRKRSRGRLRTSPV